MAASEHSRAVPNYTVYGNQHHMSPYKDKSHLESQDIRHARWLAPSPGIRSRSELLQARKGGRVPGTSYDLDGDGGVGHHDYFVGRTFDKDRDGRLSPGERAQADKALHGGFIDHYLLGLDATGQSSRGGAIVQNRFAVAGPDNRQDLSVLSYPPHPSSDKVPPHATRTSLQISRKAEMRGYGAAVGERWHRASAPVREQQPLNAETEPRKCEIGHIRERAEADHQAARVKAGLLPCGTTPNPERESRSIGLGYDASPAFQTRSQIIDARKEGMRRECEELRQKGEEFYVPLSVRGQERDVREFEFRRPQGEQRTLTTLKDDRKREKIEYEMAHFSYPTVLPREYPRFSDHPDVPFWSSAQSGLQSVKSPNADKALARSDGFRNVSRTVSEPVLKVNEVPWQQEQREVGSDLPRAAHHAGSRIEGSSAKETGSQTVKRWTTEMIEHGSCSNQPRLFAGLKPLRVDPKDLENLDLTSSLEPVRKAAVLRKSEEKRRIGVNPRASGLWAEASGTQPFQEVRSKGSQERRVSVSRSPVPQRPTMPAALDETIFDARREPRFFGSPESTKSPGDKSIRCGAFQKLDWVPRNSPSSKEQTLKDQTQGGQHRRRSRSESKVKDASGAASPSSTSLAR
eukprot:TRINITY_DN55392_c0_g1_i1.p1 TRINITY_DN55392_c0_g1~~TRINITY_DN55392_c0_g1_i1.p1  ORF type:complete len:631 (-),score=69.52 TRINITY_DN55392_c0_g1_i1:176-2068(-)